MIGRPPVHSAPAPNRIRELRERLGLSQTDLARRCGGQWNNHQISRLESGKSALEVRQLPILAAALGVEPAELLPGAVNQDIAINARIAEDGIIAPFDATHLPHARLLPQMDPRHVRAALVTDGALAPIVADGAVVFWDGDERVRPDLLLGRLCFVTLRDGRAFVRTVISAEAGRYHLLGNGRPLMAVEISWAAPIRAILPDAGARDDDNGELHHQAPVATLRRRAQH